jgi:CTP:molybdopterin cytidylyltransferase MocA
VSAAGESEAGARFTALVLAGSRGPRDPVAAYGGRPHKCLVPAGGVPMLVRVVEALAASAAIGPILIALPEPAILDDLPALAALRREGRCRPVSCAASPSLSVLAALDQAPGSLPLLVTTADHPLLDPAMVEGFCKAARATGADLAVGLTSASVLLGAYPAAQRTFLRFRDERYSGANLFALLRPEARRAVVFWRRVEQERKRPWRLVRAFGWRALLSYGFGRLSLDAAMARASAIIGAQVVAVPLPFAEAAIDVDKPADLDLVNAILAGRG